MDATAQLEEEQVSGGCYFIFHKGEEDGPFSRGELEALRESGRVSPATPCRPRSASEWHDLAFVLSQASPAKEEPATQPEKVAVAEQTASVARHEESLKEILAGLREAVHVQNRQLSTIKWSLFLLILMTAGVIVALR